MILEGIEEFNIDAENSYIVGDKLSDAEAGMKAGVKGVVVQTGLEPVESIENKDILLYKSLYEFAKDLMTKTKNQVKK